MSDSKRFPILSQTGASIPIEVLVENTEGLQKNFPGRSLAKIAERGGFSWEEVYAVILNRRMEHIPMGDMRQAKKKVLEYIARHESTGQINFTMGGPVTVNFDHETALRLGAIVQRTGKSVPEIMKIAFIEYETKVLAGG